MKKGNCFLSSTDKTHKALLYITDVVNEEYVVLWLFISPSNIHKVYYGLERKDFDKNVVVMPSSIYPTINQMILDYIEDAHQILQSETIEEEFEFEEDCHYTDGKYIYSMQNCIEDKWYYKLFKIEDDYISPEDTDVNSPDFLKSKVLPISDETYYKIYARYKTLYKKIIKLLNTAQSQQPK